MPTRLQFILFGIVVSAATVDAAWVLGGHFDVDGLGFAGIAALSIILAAAGLFYERVRKEERLAAMLLGTSFLLGMSASFSCLNYLLLTVAGHRIDDTLAALDRALGVDWPAMMIAMSHHPVVNALLQLAYISVLPQVALLVVLLGWRGKHENIYAFCLALTVGAAISIFVWTLAPSFGAFSVYELPAEVSQRMPLALDAQYAKDLMSLLANGPGHISPTSAKGLIGFPSFHAAMAMMVVWYARELSTVRWFVLALNLAVLVATPIQGGHHVVDVLAGFGVAVIGVVFANAMTRPAGTRVNALGVETATVQPLRQISP